MKCGYAHSGFILLFLGIIFVGQVLALTEQEVGIDGLRCDSCGMECSTVCGSRQFRFCCFNYIKKRGDPALSPSGQKLNHPSGGSETSSSQGKTLEQSALPSMRLHPSRPYRRSIGGGGLIALNSNDIPFEYEATDELRWYPSLAGELHRLEEDERVRPSKIRGF